MSRENSVRLPVRFFHLPILALLALLAAAAVSLAPVRASAEESVVVVLGDSLVAGYGLEQGEAFPERLESALLQKGHNVRVINAGVSGDTTAGGLSRLDWSVPDEADGVIVELGANDALRGIEPGASKANLASIIERLQAGGKKVLLAGMMAPPNLGESYGEAFNGMYHALSQQYDVPLYPFFLDGVAAVPALNQADGIHPTADGIAIMVERFLPTAERFVESLQEASVN